MDGAATGQTIRNWASRRRSRSTAHLLRREFGHSRRVRLNVAHPPDVLELLEEAAPGFSTQSDSYVNRSGPAECVKPKMSPPEKLYGERGRRCGLLAPYLLGRIDLLTLGFYVLLPLGVVFLRVRLKLEARPAPSRQSR
jgi:hypothetical protein